ncbi:MAG: chemotaxis response regulator protein-glutamate methylesterase [Candidatus Methylomirabilota bacterium]|nr:chemotaxis-specific protein-glutamate methyltransferase CheB [Candidatus Methylomirabilis sp.]NJD67186.1 chemotaxis-specific protein-glutamate methyltransferase CheB [candidate division NC10 bacterium]PWB46601.1 MAG: chemotaxis response regulator protein-glutamate methylesterase [candidate division NC10 bacterium]
MIRIVVADDSATVREYLVYLLRQDPTLEVVGAAKEGLEVVEQAERLKPDIILMDVNMPRLNGFEATRRIMERVPTPIVMVSASFSRDEMAMTFEALKAGALMVVDKPGGPDHPNHVESARRLVEAVKLMAEVKVVRRWRRAERLSAVRGMIEWATARPCRLIAIGASTGGPPVMAEILRGLPRDLMVAVLVVQHIVPGFIGGLCDWLGMETRLTVKPAETGEAIRSGTVYLAPDGLQMGVTPNGRIRLTKGSEGGSFCPSVSYLFQSVADSYGRSAVGILLTGMGRDGADGLKRLRDAGGMTIAQDEASSAVFGMPGEAIRLGAAEYVLSPEQIAATIRSLATR